MTYTASRRRSAILGSLALACFIAVVSFIAYVKHASKATYLPAADTESSAIYKLTQQLTSYQPADPGPALSAAGVPAASPSASIQATAKQRSDLLLALIEKDPAKAAAQFLPPPVADNLSSAVGGDLVEKPLSVSGKLVILDADATDSAHPARPEMYRIDTDTASYELNPTDSLDSVTSGSQVAVSGMFLRGHLVTETAGLSVLSAAASLPKPTGTLRILAIPLQFSNLKFSTDAATTIQADLTQQLTGDFSANSYFSAASSKKLGVTGKVLPLYTSTKTLSDCNTGAISDEGLASAQRAGIDVGPNAYDKIVFVYPNIPSCNFGGIAELSGRNMWINGVVDGPSTLIHEIGHTLGLAHAQSIACDTKQIAPTDTCSIEEYGNPWDIMGTGTMAASLPKDFTYSDLDAPHKIQLGFLADNAVQTATSSGTYTLNSYETSSATAVKTLVIPLAQKDPLDRPGEAYYLEYRPADAALLGKIHADLSYGLAVNRFGADTSGYGPTTLLNLNPSLRAVHGTFYSFLNLGGNGVATSFTDSIHGVTIKMLKESANSATFTVQLGAVTDPTPTPTPTPTATASATPSPSATPTATPTPTPTPTATPTSSPTPVACVRTAPSITTRVPSKIGVPNYDMVYSVIVKNLDSVGCAASTYSISPSLPSTKWSSTLAGKGVESPSAGKYPLTLSPGKSTSVTVTITAKKEGDFGSYPIPVFIRGNSLESSVVLEANLLQDTVKPTAGIVSPAAGTALQLGQTTTITATGSDNFAISQAKFYVNNILIGTATAPDKSSTSGTSAGKRYSYDWTVTGVSTKTPDATIRVQLVDGSGNIGLATQAVTIPVVASVPTPTPNQQVTFNSSATDYPTLQLVPATASWDKLSLETATTNQPTLLVWVHNMKDGVVAKNVVVKLTLPTLPATNPSITATISADNATTVTQAIPMLARGAYSSAQIVPESSAYYAASGGTLAPQAWPAGAAVSDALTGGIRLGDVSGGLTNARALSISLRLTR